MKLREFLVNVDELLSGDAASTATIRNAEGLFRAFADRLERRAIDADGVRSARPMADKLRYEITARFAARTSKAPLSEADPIFALLQRLEALATKERDKWWRRRA